jgi:glycosyltransferase involved in cell wall biosynthesis
VATVTSLRVGVPPLLAALPAQTSVGRIWSHVRAGLAELGATVVVAEPGAARRRWRRGVDVWLTDGHQGPLDVPQPVVAHLHEATWADPDLRPLFEPGFLATYEGPSADAARRATRVITASSSSRDQIVRAYGRVADDVDVVHNGLDHATYRPGLEPPGPLIAAAGGDPDLPYVLFVSVVHPRKNLPALRTALEALARRGVRAGLVVVAGPAADRADSGDLGRDAVAPLAGIDAPVVNLAGVGDPEVARLMAGAAAFCLPSLMEGFGMAVAEAMACGAPVVVSDRGALPEVVGDAGLVTEPNAAAVEAALHRVLTDGGLADDLRRRALERAAAFSWEATSRGVLVSLERAVSDRGR